MEPLWEGDERGHGVADGRRLSGDLDEFRRVLTSPDWVAEEPEAHLRPRKAHNIGQIRAALFALVGQIAETATYVRQRPQRAAAPNPPGEVVFEVATGIPAGDGPFATHGHLVRIRVQPTTRP